MKFSEIIEQASTLLQSKGRLSYRALKLEFDLSEEQLEVLKGELIEVQELAVDKDGKMLVWTGTPGEPPARTAERTRAAAPAPRGARPAEAERRQLTVMFCDLVDSTALAAQLDPEEWREVVRAYHQSSAAVIAQYEGHIAQYLGDGLLVYFGYPVAHEDDAQRAVRTALALVAALPHLSLPTPPFLPPLQVRVGIHTGVVVVGEMGSSGNREQLALGDTPNVAARLQGLAAPNTVVISTATSHLIDGLFDCRDLGARAIKGVALPLQVYQVVGDSGVRSRLDAAASRGLTPLVGREEESGLLRRRWEQAKTGDGQVVLLSGEAGIGKSRLVQVLKEQVAQDISVRVEYRCSPYHQNSAFYPVIDHLHRLLQFAPHDIPQAKLTKLQQTLAQYHFPQADTLPLLAALLSLPHPEGAPPITLDPQKQKQKTLDALVAWLVQEAARHPVLVVVEDVHWVDPSTLEFLSLLLEQVPTTRLLLLLTFRPDFTPPWAMFSHITHLTLSRLARRQVEVMVEKVTGGKAMPTEVIQQLITKTDGVPLFVEELTKMVVESGLLRATEDHYELRGPLPPLAIPATLQDSLIARLDRLATVKEVAQLGATLGREFSYELLQAVARVEEKTLQAALAKLVDAELLYQRGLPPQARYLFKHALIQDAAYQSLLKSTRQHYHHQIAQVLAERFPDLKDNQPELLAHHYTEAGLMGQAIAYWQQAGQRAIERSANLEAISHLSKGLTVVQGLPDTPECVQHELTLQLTLSSALSVAKGYAAPEVGTAVTRARELCQQLGETPQLLPMLFRLSVVYINRGELQTALELAEQMMRLAQRVQARDLLSGAHLALGATLNHRGELTAARTHIEQTLALYDPQTPLRTAIGTTDLRVNSLSHAAHNLWYLGYPAQSRKRSQEVVALAEELSHSYSLAYTLMHAALLHLIRREEQGVRERAEVVITLSTEQGFRLLLALATMLRGGALAKQGQVEEGIAQMQQGQAAYRAMGAKLAEPYILAELAEAYGKVGQVDKGLSMLAEALAAVDSTGERVYEAELYRLKGELTLQSSIQSLESRVKEAEACFLKAIEIARRQQAKSLELRAVMSLSRLWQMQGKKEEARQMLTEIYGWFTEGFDTKDLQEAKALLQELSEEQ